MTLKGAIAELILLQSDSLMPEFFKPCFQKIIETISMDCAEVRHGKLVHIYDDPVAGKGFTICSECDGKIDPKDKWCKHCGAKIDEGDWT